jgi:hypothetical protein
MDLSYLWLLNGTAMSHLTFVYRSATATYETSKLNCNPISSLTFCNPLTLLDGRGTSAHSEAVHYFHSCPYFGYNEPIRKVCDTEGLFFYVLTFIYIKFILNLYLNVSFPAV